MISQYTKQGYHGINQDACGFLEYDGKVIMAIADGHGHYLHFRSDIGSYLAVEGITSPDGRILGKMGHSERIGKDLYKNVPGNYELGLFASAVAYFRK